MRQARTRNTDTLEFVHSMLGQLRRMAEDEQHEVLAYMIEMACIEADDTLRDIRGSLVRSGQGDSAA
ncbi:hypothetical protein GTW25_04810 [Aliihoeflea aestuarii]|nr:hypothetical protein [Aliihoeflea aestuarii]